jgi:two-component system sensor histidine kinase KdpD
MIVSRQRRLKLRIHKDGGSAHPAPEGLDMLAPMEIRLPNSLKRYLVALPVILLAVVLAQLMQPHFDRTNVVMVYMLAVVVVAFRLGTGPAVMSCLLSVLLYDFINVPPYFSFGSETAIYEYAFTLAAMLITAGIVGMLADRLKQKASESQEQGERSARLYALSTALADLRSGSEVQECAIRHISNAFAAGVEFFPAAGRPGHEPAPGPTELPQGGDRIAPLYVVENGRQVQATVPLVVAGRPDFFVSVKGPMSSLGTGAQRDHLAAMLGQCALALERIRLQERIQAKEILIQKEMLRNSILNALSHDLRTPLTAIVSASSAFLTEFDALPKESLQGMGAAIFEESSHMLHMVENLLDMAKLQGDIPLVRKWEDLEEIVGSAATALRRRAKAHVFNIDVPHGLPFIYCDAVLLERVLINLLENAVKFSPLGSVVSLTAASRNGCIEVAVGSQGVTIPPEEREKVFDPFYRLHREVSGGGLGLTICRSIVEAHDGRIWIEAAETPGTVVRFTLPMPADMPEALLEASAGLPGE